jgi:hypothetical protein
MSSSAGDAPCRSGARGSEFVVDADDIHQYLVYVDRLNCLSDCFAVCAFHASTISRCTPLAVGTCPLRAEPLHTLQGDTRAPGEEKTEAAVD